MANQYQLHNQAGSQMDSDGESASAMLNSVPSEKFRIYILTYPPAQKD